MSLLTIEPGVEVLVDGPYEIEILTPLTIAGTPVAPIRFAAKNQTIRWKGLYFDNLPSGTILSYCIGEFSDKGAFTLTATEHFTIDHSVIRHDATGSRNEQH